MADVVKADDGTQDEVKEINDGKNPLEIPVDEKPAVNIYEPTDEDEGKVKADGEEGKENEPGSPAEGAVKKEESKKEEEVVKLPTSDEITELRQIARDQKRQLTKLSEELLTAQEVLKKAELLPSDDPEVMKKTQELQELRANTLETMLEMMELNPKFEDVREVITQSRFDDIAEAMANYAVKEEGGKPSDLGAKIKEVESAIWSMTNPYKFMYDKIKKFHPDFVVPPKDEVVADDKTKNAGTKDKKKDEALPPKVPGSILDLRGGGSGDAGWTSAMIDALEETELAKVPPKIYEQYLMNNLA